MVNRPEAKFTEAASTPYNLLTAFSTALAHPAQLIPLTGNICMFTLFIVLLTHKNKYKTNTRYHLTHSPSA